MPAETPNIAPDTIGMAVEQVNIAPERKETQQDGDGTRNRVGTPLALRFHGEMPPRFGKRDFDLPALDKLAHDLRRRLIQTPPIRPQSVVFTSSPPNPKKYGP